MLYSRIQTQKVLYQRHIAKTSIPVRTLPPFKLPHGVGYDKYYCNMMEAHFKQWEYSDELELLDFVATCKKNDIATETQYMVQGIPPQKIVQKIVNKFEDSVHVINEVRLPMVLHAWDKASMHLNYMYENQLQFLEDIKVLLKAAQ